MDTTHSHEPARTDRNTVHTALVVAFLWLVAAAALLFTNRDDWEWPYAVFSAFLLIASAATTFLVVQHTATAGHTPIPRFAAIALAILATASTVVAWAFVLWAVLLAAGYAALAVTGSPHGRRALWLSGALLAGVGVAFVGVTAKLGPAGDDNNYGQAQGWGIAVACVLAATVLAVLARSAAEAPAPA